MRVYAKLGLMSGSAVILSAATIMYFNSTFTDEHLGRVYSNLELAAITLMPYMISAAVAAITAISITTLLPLLKVYRTVEPLQERLRLLAAGDLTSRIQSLSGSQRLSEIALEFNNTVASLGNDIAQWKLVNRQQWEVLQSIRREAVAANNQLILVHIEKMEENWSKIAEIEDRLIT